MVDDRLASGLHGGPRTDCQSHQCHSESQHQQPDFLAQKGGVEALRGSQDHLKSWLPEFDRRRRFAHEQLASMPGVSCVNAQGAFYLLPEHLGDRAEFVGLL